MDIFYCSHCGYLKILNIWVPSVIEHPKLMLLAEVEKYSFRGILCIFGDLPLPCDLFR